MLSRRRHPLRWPHAGLALLPVLLPWGCAPAAGSPQSIQPPPLAQSALVAEPNPLSLGTLHPGQDAQGPLTLRNPGAAAVTVARVETSCDCIRVATLPLRVDPGEAAGLQVHYESDGTADFQGTLTVDLTGFGADGAEVFRTVIRVQVLPGGVDNAVPR